MRLQQIYHIVKSNYPIIEEATTAKVATQNDRYSIGNWDKVSISLAEVRKVGALEAGIDNIYEISTSLRESKKQAIITGSASNTYAQKRSALLNNMKAIIDLCESMGISEITDHEFEVKIPIHNDFILYADTIKKFNIFLKSCPILNREKIKLRGTDIGSEWLIFAVDSGEILGIILGLAFVGVKIRNEFWDGSIKKEKANKLKQERKKRKLLESKDSEIDDKGIDSMTEKSIRLHAELGAVEAYEKYNEFKKNVNPEDKKVDTSKKDGKKDPSESDTENETINRIANSLIVLGKSMAEGLEIHPSIKVPEEERQNFTKINNAESLDVTVKLLEEFIDDDNS